MEKLWKFFKQDLLKLGIYFLILFVPLYPKLPSIHITHTWVYIRLEDFFIFAIVLLWFFKFLANLINKKNIIPFKLSLPIFSYWSFGLLSVIFSLIFIAPHLANFFPSIALLSYFRRIEYMALFFVAFSTVKSVRDLRNYLIVLGISVLAIAIYGFGQRFYLDLWQAFPDFFRHYSFCFPSFQTGNEEFAKGVPLCLPKDARITSTFAGHYDLAAYLVLIIPIFLSVFFTLKKNLHRIALFLLTLSSITLLIFTASRISFIAYLFASMLTLVYVKKKKFIIPLIVLSIALLLIFSGSTAKRFMETFRIASVVTNNQGQVVGQVTLPEDLKNKISDNILENVPTQNLPVGSGYLGLPQLNAQQKTDTAIVSSALSIAEAKRLKLENGGVEISTLSGSFLIKKVLVYDISFTTRFQAEWPNAWSAFIRNPLLGSGFATITLAADNDYLRALGESGLLGIFSFAFIFILFYIVLKETLPKADNLSRAYLLGISGGIIGLLINAVLIDVFEASKVAETFWILLGIAAGTVYLYKKEFDFKKRLMSIFSSKPMIIFYLFFATMAFYINSTVNFFVADDFTWLKWAANATVNNISGYFIDSGGFFFRPLSKTLFFFLYTAFSFQPQGYHMFFIIVHFLTAIGVYVLAKRLLGRKIFAFIAAFIFLALPAQAEDVYWIATISTNISAFFIIYLLIFWTNFRKTGSYLQYILTLIFSILAFLSYEVSIVILPLLVLMDIFLSRINMKHYKNYFVLIPFIVLTALYPVVRLLTNSLSSYGDYSYNLLHLLPNFLGNFLGYLGIFIFGENSISFYTQFRNIFRENMILSGSVILIFLGISIFIISRYKNKLLEAKENKSSRIVIFSFLFIFISLIPFLGLGNIAQRYGYLASVGFSILAALFLDKLSGLFKVNKYKQYILIGLTVIIGAIYFYQVNIANSEWKEAGRITNRTLAYLRLYYDGNHPNSNFYFVNVPIRKSQAWIFPVGLEDGVWFIYRDETIKVYQISSLKEGQQIAKNSAKGKNFVFSFDKNGNIYEVK